MSVIEVVKTQVVEMSPEATWTLIGDPADLARWIPGVGTLEMKDNVRSIAVTGPDGAALPPTVERIVARDDARRTYTYEYVSGALPLDTYRSTISVEPHDADQSRAIVRWAATFTTPPDKEEWMNKRISRSYENALKGLAKSQT